MASPLETRGVNDTLSSGFKPKKPATVTPKRFTKFFTPRDSVSSRRNHQSKAGRQLRDITKNGANRRRTLPLKDRLLGGDEGEYLSPRPIKRRKQSFELSSSPPQSSPLKHVQATDQTKGFKFDLPSPTISVDEELPDLLEDFQPFPKPIRRLRSTGPVRRVLHRSFGGFNATDRGWRGLDHCADWLASTANYVSSPTEQHQFRGGALPFCATSCNTNSLVAIGDEEGGIRLIDSSPKSDFTQTHISFRPHHNAIMDIAFNSDDFHMATAAGDQSARLIDMHTQQTVCILAGHTSSVKQVRFRPNDDNSVTTCSRDGSVQVWDLRCASRGSVQTLNNAFARAATVDGEAEPVVKFPIANLDVGPAHRSEKSPSTKSSRILNSPDSRVSVTAIQHLANGREHLLLTSSELNSSIKLWDLRNASRRNTIPLSSTPLPESHCRTRNYGTNALALSSDGARLYAVCRDSTVYAYSVNHLVLGCVPEMTSSNSRRRLFKEPMRGVGPLYGFKHPELRTGSFFVRASLRQARGNCGEMLAVGSTNNCAVLFPTDEQYLQRREPQLSDAEIDENEAELPSIPSPRLAQGPGYETPLQIYEHGTALVRGHDKEVTSLSWTHDGELVTIGDDYNARCWRANASKARRLRSCGEGEGSRWGHGWADVHGDWDEEDG